MKSLKCAFVCAIIFLAVPQVLIAGNNAPEAGDFGTSETGTLVILNGTDLSLALDKTRGSIIKLEDIEAGWNFFDEANPAILFEILLTNPWEKKELVLNSDDFADVTFNLRDDAHGSEIQAVFSGVDKTLFTGADKADLKVTCRFRARDFEGGIRANIEVLNNTRLAVERIAFPVTLVRNSIGEEAENDRLLMPHGGGVIYKNPGSLPLDVEYKYPGLISFQMMAYFDDEAGLYISTEDPEGNCKRYRAESFDDRIDLTIHHYNEAYLGGDYLKNYPVLLSTTRAPWYNAADKYKAWATEQPWCRTKLHERPDAPQWLKEGPIFLLTYADIGKIHAPTTKLPPGDILDMIINIRDMAGVKDVIYAPIGWEKSGRWLGPHYLPPQPSEAWWKEFTSIAKPEGVHACLMTSGFKWVFHHNYPTEAEPFDYRDEFRERQYMAITRTDGEPFLEGDVDNRGWTGGRKSRICRGHPQGREWMTEIFTGIAELGADASQIDQDRGGQEKQPCYNPDHDHPPGWGKWMWEDFRRWHQQKDNAVRAINPDFFSFQEDENELTIPYQPSSWTRDYAILDFLHPYAWGIPAYSYLYHEYVTTIGAAHFGGQGVGGNPVDPRMHAYSIGRCLAYGLIVGINGSFIMPNEDGVPETIPSKAYASFCRPISDHSEYLILGKKLRPNKIECANTAIPFRRRNSSTGETDTFPIELPAVMQGVFKSPEGKVGIILVNPTEESQEAILTLNKEYLGKEGKITEYRMGKEVNNHVAGKELTIRMKALEPVFLELR